MDSSKPVTRLATSVWSEANEEMKAPLQFLPKSSIPKDKEEIYMTNVTESCVFRSCMSFVVGGALGRYSNNRDTISVTGTGKVYSKA